MTTMNITHKDDYRRCHLCHSIWRAGEQEYDQMMVHNRKLGRWKCRDCQALRMRAYAKTPTGRAAFSAVQHNRRGARGRLTKADVRDLYALYGHRCQWPGCGATEDLSLDHIVPLSKGGENSIAFAGILCRSHNSARGNRSTEDYRPDGGLRARLLTIYEGKGLPLVSFVLAVLCGLAGG
jgi:hypothetical protein